MNVGSNFESFLSKSLQKAQKHLAEVGSSAAMRRRSTFIHDPKVDVDPSQLQLAGDQFKIRELKAAREERLTVGFSELPQEV